MCLLGGGSFCLWTAQIACDRFNSSSASLSYVSHSPHSSCNAPTSLYKCVRLDSQFFRPTPALATHRKTRKVRDGMTFHPHRKSLAWQGPVSADVEVQAMSLAMPMGMSVIPASCPRRRMRRWRLLGGPGGSTSWKACKAPGCYL